MAIYFFPMHPSCRSFFFKVSIGAAVFLASVYASFAGDPIPSCALPVGETLKYDIYWGFIPVGHSEMTSSWVEENGKQLINLRFTARSNRFVEKIYPVNDRIDCFIDPQSQLPTRLVKKTSEGHYKCDDTLTFDRELGMARWDDRQNQTNCEYGVTQDARDFYSLMFAMRAQEFRSGEEREFTVACDDRTYGIKVLVGAEEKIELFDGRTVPVARLKVEQAQKGLFVRKIPGAVWVSRDDPRMVVKMQVRVPVGSVRVVLAGRCAGQTASVCRPARSLLANNSCAQPPPH